MNIFKNIICKAKFYFFLLHTYTTHTFCFVWFPVIINFISRIFFLNIKLVHEYLCRYIKLIILQQMHDRLSISMALTQKFNWDTTNKVGRHSVSK